MILLQQRYDRAAHLVDTPVTAISQGALHRLYPLFVIPPLMVGATDRTKIGAT
jgi:hypothetical protein